MSDDVICDDCGAVGVFDDSGFLRGWSRAFSMMRGIPVVLCPRCCESDYEDDYYAEGENRPYVGQRRQKGDGSYRPNGKRQ